MTQTALFATASPSEISREALISPCGRYRYWLSRTWAAGKRLPFIMLNPSTADAELDDPTIRRCIGFARREGFAGVTVHNLFAFRATNPEDMRAVGAAAVGPLNDHHLGQLFAKSRSVPIVAAWGANGDHQGRAELVKWRAQALGADLRCLGVTKENHPRHPLYVRGDQPLERFA